MKNEGVCSRFDLGLVGVENEEQRKNNEGRKGRTMGQQERKFSM